MTRERITAKTDAEWWREMLAPGWRLIGFTDRYHAIAQSPGGRTVEIDGELVADLAALRIATALCGVGH